MYKGFIIVIKEGQARETVSSTDEPFTWFPELKPMFEHFNIKEMEFEIESPVDVFRKFFRIAKVG